MESALLSTGVSAMPIFSLYKSLNSRPYPLIGRLSRRQVCVALLHLSRCGELGGSVKAPLARGFGLMVPRRNRIDCSARYSSSFGASGGGIDGIEGGGGGGGDGAGEGGESKPSVVADGPGLSSEVIILEVGGMTCGGCAASVKRILESQPQVSSASVNLTTETAIVWPVSEAKILPDWRNTVGEALAKHLTNCGFKSNLKDAGALDEDTQS